MFKLVQVLLVVGVIAACKLQTISDEQSVISADDGVKIAANYIGEARCQNYLQEAGRDAADIARVIAAHANFASHKLHGKNGELITKQFKQARNKPHAQLSGDRFLSRNSHEPFVMEEMEANCRRLVLSIDSHAPPILQMQHGYVSKDQQQLLTQDFGEQGFGTLQCGENLCTFSNIAGTGGSTRYFALIEPALGQEHIQLAIKYFPDNRMQQVSIDKIELENMRFRNPHRYQNQPQALPTPRPRDPHLNYVRDLYVRAVGGENWHKLPDDTQVKVFIQLRGEDGRVRWRYKAETDIVMYETDIFGNVKSSTNSRKRTATLNVSSICERLLKEDCGTQQAAFPSLLLSKHAELALVFERRNSQQAVFTHHQPLTPALLDNLLDRKGTLNVTGEGWRMEFAFDNSAAKHLYLYAEREIKGVAPRYVYFDPGVGCGQDSGKLAVKNKVYTTLWKDFKRADGSAAQYMLLKIDAAKLRDHFKKQQCLRPTVTGKTLGPALKSLDLTMVVHNRKFYNYDIKQKTRTAFDAWTYQLHDEDIDAWLDARGGIIVIPSHSASDETLPTLEIGFQNRR